MQQITVCAVSFIANPLVEVAAHYLGAPVLWCVQIEIDASSISGERRVDVCPCRPGRKASRQCSGRFGFAAAIKVDRDRVRSIPGLGRNPVSVGRDCAVAAWSTQYLEDVT